MQSCLHCSSRNKIFTFYNDATNYESAIQKCRNKNPAQNIATFLNVADYQNLLACCKNGRSYWIGLKNDDRNCTYASQRLRWNNGGRCFNGRPLNIQHQPTNGNCFAVSIETRTPDSRNIIQAGLSSCHQTQGYICERLIDNSPTQRTTTATLSSRITTAGTANNTQKTSKLYTKPTNPTHKMTEINMRIQQATTPHTLFLKHQNTSVNSIRNATLSSTFEFKNAYFNNYIAPIVGGSIVLIILAFFIGFLCGRHSKRNKLNESISPKPLASSNRTVSAKNNLPGSHRFDQSIAANPPVKINATPSIATGIGGAKNFQFFLTTTSLRALGFLKYDSLQSQLINTEQRKTEHHSSHLNEDNQYDVVFNKQSNEELPTDESTSVYCQIKLVEKPKDYENVDKLKEKTNKYKKKSNSTYLSPIGLQTNRNKSGKSEKSTTSSTYL